MSTGGFGGAKHTTPAHCNGKERGARRRWRHDEKGGTGAGYQTPEPPPENHAPLGKGKRARQLGSERTWGRGRGEKKNVKGGRNTQCKYT